MTLTQNLLLGEIDRARAIYGHCSQICDPRMTTEFWQIWKEFEVRHGNEDTMREMLRIKRSVQAMYNTQVLIFGISLTRLFKYDIRYLKSRFNNNFSMFFA